MKIARLIVYEGELDALAKQLGRALPEGRVEKPGITLSIVDLGVLSEVSLQLFREIFGNKKGENHEV